MDELKQLAAVIEGLAKKLQDEHDFREQRLIAQTLVDYGRAFDRVFLSMLAKEGGHTVAMSKVVGPELSSL